MTVSSVKSLGPSTFDDTKDKKLEDGTLVHITATPTNDGISTPITLSSEELAAYKLDHISGMTAEEISAYEIDPVVEAQVRWQYDKVSQLVVTFG
jgi:hypothetical protein